MDASLVDYKHVSNKIWPINYDSNWFLSCYTNYASNMFHFQDKFQNIVIQC